MSYAVVVATTPNQEADPVPDRGSAFNAASERTQLVRDTVTGEVSEWSIYARAGLATGARIAGPAIVVEDETSTLIGPGWSALVNGVGYIEMVRE